MPLPPLDTALPAGADAREHARLLRRVHEATLSGRRPPAPPRTVVADSWDRTRRLGIDPDNGAPPRTTGPDQLHRDRTASPIAEVLALIRHSLVPIAEQADHIMLVTDASGQILWREGCRRVRSVGDRVGLVEGAYWNEAAAGTNAIGTALEVGRPVQIHSAEHYVRNLHTLTCACAPVHDPRDGRLLGAVDVTGPLSTVHPSTLALVHTAARLAEAHLQSIHHTHLERLRSVAAPLLAGLSGPALVVDDSGWTAAAVRTEPVRRIPLPHRGAGDRAWLPALGECTLEPLPGGWLVRPRPRGERAPTSLTLDLRGPQPAVAVSGDSGQWAYHPSLRHAELLLLLALHRSGRTARQLSQDLFGAPGHVVTVRAELSRVRRRLGGVIASRPYRFGEQVDVQVHEPGTPEDLLPSSRAPAVLRLRRDRGGGAGA